MFVISNALFNSRVDISSETGGTNGLVCLYVLTGCVSRRVVHRDRRVASVHILEITPSWEQSDRILVCVRCGCGG